MKTAYIHNTLPRILTLLLAALMLCTLFTLPLAAEEPAWEIVDDAGLLTGDQLSELTYRTVGDAAE